MPDNVIEIWRDLVQRYPFLRGPRMWQLLLVFGFGLLLLVIFQLLVRPAQQPPGQ